MLAFSKRNLVYSELDICRRLFVVPCNISSVRPRNKCRRVGNNRNNVHFLRTSARIISELTFYRISLTKFVTMQRARRESSLCFPSRRTIHDARGCTLNSDRFEWSISSTDGATPHGWVTATRNYSDAVAYLMKHVYPNVDHVNCNQTN